MHAYKPLVKQYLSKYFKARRASQGLTKEKMSEQLRVAPRSYSDLENEKYCPSSPTLLFLMLSLETNEVVLFLQGFRSAVEAADQGGSNLS